MELDSYEAPSKQEVWRKVMEKEIKMIKKNNTWDLVDLPREKEVIGVKWSIRQSGPPNSDGSI